MPIVDFFVSTVGCGIMRLILPLISFGKIHVEPFDGHDRQFNWFGYRRDERGRVEIESAAAGQMGLVLCVVCLVITLHFF